MANKNTNIIIGVLVFGLIIFFFLGNSVGVFSIVSGGSVVRTGVPMKATTGDTFSVFYMVTPTTDSYGVSIQDKISGGCTFSTGTTFKAFNYLKKNVVHVRVNTPDTEATCVLSGDYKFGDGPVEIMPSSTIIVVEGSECETSSDCTKEGEICYQGLCIDEDDPSVIEDGFLRKMAVGILEAFGVDTNGIEEGRLNAYIILTFLGIIGILYFIIKYVFLTK